MPGAQRPRDALHERQPSRVEPRRVPAPLGRVAGLVAEPHDQPRTVAPGRFEHGVERVERGERGRGGAQAHGHGVALQRVHERDVVADRERRRRAGQPRERADAHGEVAARPLAQRSSANAA
jgi:hypothetical protein